MASKQAIIYVWHELLRKVPCALLIAVGLGFQLTRRPSDNHQPSNLLHPATGTEDTYVMAL
jgi:hypothetical protein